MEKGRAEQENNPSRSLLKTGTTKNEDEGIE